MRPSPDTQDPDGRPGGRAILVGDGDRKRRQDAQRLGERHVHLHAFVQCACGQRDLAEDPKTIEADAVPIGRGAAEWPPWRRLELREDKGLIDVAEPGHANDRDGPPVERLLRED